MLMTKGKRRAIRTLRGWAISVLDEAGSASAKSAVGRRTEPTRMPANAPSKLPSRISRPEFLRTKLSQKSARYGFRWGYLPRMSAQLSVVPLARRRVGGAARPPPTQAPGPRPLFCFTPISSAHPSRASSPPLPLRASFRRSASASPSGPPPSYGAGRLGGYCTHYCVSAILAESTMSSPTSASRSPSVPTKAPGSEARHWRVRQMPASHRTVSFEQIYSSS